MAPRVVLVLAALVVAGLVAGLVLAGGDEDAVPRPAGVPEDAPYVDGVLEQVTVDRLVVRPAGGAKPVELAVTLQRAGKLDLPHLINFHQARDEPVRVYYVERGGRRVAVAEDR